LLRDRGHAECRRLAPVIPRTKPASGLASEPSVFDLACGEHIGHLALIDSALAKGADRASVAERLATHLRCHTRVEQAVVLGLLLVEDSVRPLARRVIAAQFSLQRVLADMAVRAHDGGNVAADLLEYRARFLEYRRIEERELFPAAWRVLGPDRCVRLYRSYELARVETLARYDHMLAR
jgi:hypothetical protein